MLRWLSPKNFRTCLHEIDNSDFIAEYLLTKWVKAPRHSILVAATGFHIFNRVRTTSRSSVGACRASETISSGRPRQHARNHHHGSQYAKDSGFYKLGRLQFVKSKCSRGPKYLRLWAEPQSSPPSGYLPVARVVISSSRRIGNCSFASARPEQLSLS